MLISSEWYPNVRADFSLQYLIVISVSVRSLRYVSFPFQQVKHRALISSKIIFLVFGAYHRLDWPCHLTIQPDTR